MSERTSNTKFRKILSSILAITFVLSSLVIPPALAAVYPVSAPQIQSGYNPQKTSEDGMVLTSKSISPTDAENVFDIELKIVTQSELETVSLSENAAVVLVLDVSNSMKENLPNGGGQRLAAAKAAANAFVDSFISGASGSKRMISVVKFGSNAERVVNWTDAASAPNATAVKNSITSDVKISSNENDGGTNIEGGLLLAYNLIGQTGTGQALEGFAKEQLYVILLTDGAPTYHVSKSADKTSTSYIDGFRGGGNVANYSQDVVPAEAMAQNVRSRATLFSIAYASGDDICYSVREWAFFFPVRKDTTIRQWLTRISNGYYNADTASELEISFDDISSVIGISSNGGLLTDPMGEYIEFLGLSSSNEHVVFNEANKTLYWNVGNDESFATSTEDDMTTYTYTLRYRIKLDTVAIRNAAGDGEFNPDIYYPTNGPTVFSYTVDEYEGEEVVNTETRSVNLNVPSVKGLFANLGFAKTAAHNVDLVLEGAKFTLENADGTLLLAAESNGSGEVSFAGIPLGVYTLAEAEAPEGYDLALASEYTVVVALGSVAAIVDKTTESEVEAIESFSVTNILETNQRKITIRKAWVDNNNAYDTRPQTISFSIKQDGNDFRSVEMDFEKSEITVNVPDLNPETGVPYVYTVVENAVNGYTSAANSDGDVFAFTNSLAQKSVTISGTKTWANVPPGTVVPDITIILKQGKAEVNRAMLASGTATFSFSSDKNGNPLPMYDLSTGAKYVYSVEEVDVDGYVTAYPKDTFDIENTFIDKEDEEEEEDTDTYSYRIIAIYSKYEDDVLISTHTVTGDVVLGVFNQVVVVNPADFAEYNGEEYEFIGGDLSATLTKANETAEIVLNYELALIDDEPPYNGADNNMNLFAALSTISGAGIILLTLSKKRKTI